VNSQLPKNYELVIPSILDKISEVESFTEKITNEMDFSQEEKDSIAIAVTEMANNAILHGNKKDQQKKVVIRYQLTQTSLTVTIKDEGAGFNPDTINNPLAPENLLKESGRGVFIVKALMDKLSYHFDGTGTMVTLVKNKA